MKTVKWFYGFVMLIILSANNVLAYNNHGYPYTRTSGCTSSCYAENLAGFNYSFCQNNCTSYVAYVLNAVYGIPFNNHYLLGTNDSWGDAGDWDNASSRVNGQNIAIDNYPLPGDVAYWEKNWTGDPNNSGDNYGHVAFVEKVHYDSNGNATQIDVTEYNYSGNGCAFGSRTISAYNPSGFIHILAYNEGVKSLHYLNCSEGGNLCSNQTPEEWLRIAARVWNQYRCTNCSSDYSLAYINAIAGGFGGSTGTPDPSDPEPTDPDSDPNLHINSFDLREIGGSWVKEIFKTLYWGQSFRVEGRMEVENRSSGEAQDVDSDYRVENKRDFDKDDAKIDEDSPFDIDPGDREEKGMSPVTITVSSDGQTVTLSCGSRTKSFPVINGFIKIYFFVDVEEDGGDHDISSESDKDEYGKVELIIRPPILANFSASVFSGTNPLTVSFTDHSTTNPTSWSWNFGDGQYSAGSNPTHTYTSPGIFTVSLTASNSLGTDSVTKVSYITVTEVVAPPEPAIPAPVLFRIVLVE